MSVIYLPAKWLVLYLNLRFGMYFLAASTNPFEAYKSVENDDCGAMQDTAICYTNLEVEPDQGGLVVRASPATLSSTEVLVDG